MVTQAQGAAACPRKAYLCDNGLAYRYMEERSRPMKNAVFLELRRMQDLDPMMSLCYWKDFRQREVDFVVKRGKNVTKLIQVTYADSRDEVRKRELASLAAASAELMCDDLVVITWNYEGVERFGGKRIVFTPLLKWLLGSKTPEKK